MPVPEGGTGIFKRESRVPCKGGAALAFVFAFY
jgi:hypothetical protein